MLGCSRFATWFSDPALERFTQLGPQSCLKAMCAQNLNVLPCRRAGARPIPAVWITWLRGTGSPDADGGAAKNPSIRLIRRRTRFGPRSGRRMFDRILPLTFGFGSRPSGTVIARFLQGPPLALRACHAALCHVPISGFWTSFGPRPPRAPPMLDHLPSCWKVPDFGRPAPLGDVGWMPIVPNLPSCCAFHTRD